MSKSPIHEQEPELLGAISESPILAFLQAKTNMIIMESTY